MKRIFKLTTGALLVMLLLAALSMSIPGFAQTKLNLTSGVADGAGNFSISVKIPNDTDPGSYELRATCNAPASGTAGTGGTYPPTSGTATVTKTSVAPGETIVMGGSGCTPNTVVTIDLVKVSAFGFLSLVGQAEAQTTTRTLTAKITVTGAAAAATTTPAAAAKTGTLAATGINVLPWLLGAVSALAIGSGLIIAGRKRVSKGESSPGV